MEAVLPPVLGHGRLEQFGTLHKSLSAQFSCIVAIVLCTLLLIFVSCMCCDQAEYLSKGYGAVGKKLAAKGQEQPLAQNSASDCTSGGKDGEKAPEMPFVLRPCMHLCAARCGLECKRLSAVMGKGSLLRWLLPTTPGALSVRTAEDEIVARAKARAARVQVEAPVRSTSPERETSAADLAAQACPPATAAAPSAAEAVEEEPRMSSTPEEGGLRARRGETCGR